MKKLNFKWLILFIAFVCSINAASAKIEKNTTDNDIKWTTIDQSLSNTKSAGKKFILVELYTDWCGWCKKMDENTFQDAAVVSAINESFTAVKFNAETSSPVTYNGKTYSFVKTGARGANQLALDLGSVGGKLGYPTLVVLDENGNKLQAFPGFKDVETLSMILKFYKSGSYKTMDFQQFQSGQ